MKRVMQTKFHEKDVSRGDCLRACIASITDFTYDELPHFTYISDYFEWFYDRCLDSTICIEISHVEKIEDIDSDGMDGLYIGVGPSSRGVLHAVIIDREGNLVHDPHFSGEGASELTSIYILEPMNLM